MEVGGISLTAGGRNDDESGVGRGRWVVARESRFAGENVHTSERRLFGVNARGTDVVEVHG
jgi:hypothetical protein